MPESGERKPLLVRVGEGESVWSLGGRFTAKATAAVTEGRFALVEAVARCKNSKSARRKQPRSDRRELDQITAAMRARPNPLLITPTRAAANVWLLAGGRRRRVRR